MIKVDQYTLWEKILDVIRKARAETRAGIDAAACQTSYDWKKLHEAEVAFEDAKGELVDLLGVEDWE